MFQTPVRSISSCEMGLVLARVVRILHDDWSIRLGENRLDRALKNFAAMLLAFNPLYDIDWSIQRIFISFLVSLLILLFPTIVE